MSRISIELVPRFAPTLAWNRRFAETVLGWLRARDADADFIPIRARLAGWLGGLL